MLQLIVLAFLLLIVFYGVRVLLQTAAPEIAAKFRQGLFVFAIVFLLLLAATGRLGWVIPLAGALLAALSRLLPVLIELFPLFQRFRRSPHDGPGRESADNRPSQGRMNREEALEILGLTANPSRQQIIDAHRRLMQKMHPDRGGSVYLASKINQARDLLLKG